jgi:hypothetical protein
VAPGIETRQKVGSARAATALAALVLLGLLWLLVAPLATPYWWDAGAVYAPGAKWLLEHGFDARPGVFPTDFSRGHAPLFFLVVAGAFRLLGASPVAGHALALGFGWMALLYTYALGRELGGAWAGVIAAALLLTAPLFLTMSSETLPEVALTALTAAAFHALAQERLAECALWGTLLVLVKETGVACPLAIAGALALHALRSGSHREGARRTAVALVPVVVLAAFFLYQKRAQGWFVLPYHAGLFRAEHPLGEQLVRVVVSIFVVDGRAVAVLGAGVLWALRRELLRARLQRHGVLLLALGLHVLANLVFFTKMFFLERYALPVHVDAVVVLATLLAPLPGPMRSLAAMVPGLATAALAIGVALARRDAGQDMASGETTFRYLHAVRAHQELYRTLEAEGGDPVVLTDWPITDELRDPFLGWVTHPFRAVDVGSYYGHGTREGPVDRVVTVPGLSSHERLVRVATELGLHLRERASEGPASIELWGP